MSEVKVNRSPQEDAAAKERLREEIATRIVNEFEKPGEMVRGNLTVDGFQVRDAKDGHGSFGTAPIFEEDMWRKMAEHSGEKR